MITVYLDDDLGSARVFPRCEVASKFVNNNNTLFRITNPETEDPEVIPITGPPS